MGVGLRQCIHKKHGGPINPASGVAYGSPSDIRIRGGREREGFEFDFVRESEEMEVDEDGH
jgi:hypothetical protein